MGWGERLNGKKGSGCVLEVKGVKGKMNETGFGLGSKG